MKLPTKIVFPGKRRILTLSVGLLLAAAATIWLMVGHVQASVPANKPDNDACLSCHGKPNMLLKVGDDTMFLTIDASKFHDSIHGQNQLNCVDCHVDMTSFPHPSYPKTSRREFQFALYQTTSQGCANCHKEQTNQVKQGVHQQTLDVGNYNAAMCADCHNPHYVEPAADLSRQEIPDVCARCHNDIATEYKASVHGAALIGQGNPDVPNCISCHSNHDIVDPRTAEFRNNIPLLCAKCHTNASIMDKYGISTNVLNTYVADFHGTTVTLFEQTSPDLPTNKPVCTDCHGVHDISNPNNPQTGIALKQNLLVKCQRCHPDATANFPDAWMNHYIASPEKYPLVYYVNLFYKFFIPAVIGGMLIFVISDIVRRLIDRRKGGAH